MSLCRKRIAREGSSPRARKAIAVSRVSVRAASGSRTVVSAWRLAMKYRASPWSCMETNWRIAP
jgi:hypothetical protein